TILQSLNILLQRHSKTVTDFDLLDLFPETNKTELPTVLIEELSYNFTIADLNKANTLNEIQLAIFDKTLSLIEYRKNGMLFVNRPARSSKTYLYDCLLTHIRVNNQ
ncbi:27317_t:CDS:1, partial [Racocetra persica]